MIQALVEEHDADGQKSEEKSKGMDIVANKERGLVLLLHGQLKVCTLIQKKKLTVAKALQG